MYIIGYSVGTIAAIVLCVCHEMFEVETRLLIDACANEMIAKAHVT